MDGLIIGKFLPLHKGHLSMIEWASKRCELLRVAICAGNKENMPGPLRLSWLNECLKSFDNIEIHLLKYNEEELPNTSESSYGVSKLWVDKLKPLFPSTSLFFSSEPYGDYVAEIWGIKHQYFDTKRKKVQVSASEIRENPFAHWAFIPKPVRPYFVKKVCLVGTQSTGKSVLTEKLAKHYNTCFVDEVGREVIPVTEDSTMELLHKIAVEHAKKILQKEKEANKLLFIDTDLIITKSYADFLFKEDLYVENWIEAANRCDLYLYSTKKAPFYQDGTRLNEEERNQMDKSHLKAFKKARVKLHYLTGDWDERFEQAVELVDQLI